ncbi:MAG: hypothetical protein V9G19_04015 [Tetrasphaera sp.]
MKRSVVVALLVGTGCAIPAAAESGLKSMQGSDYTQDFNSIRQVKACDMEADSHGVRGDYTPIGSSSTNTIYDGNGANNACEASGVYAQKIYRHRAVEVIPADFDAIGPWRYPS